MAKEPVIITCAITGAIHTPTMSDALPYTPEDITSQDPQCPEIEGFVSYCAAPPGGLSCVILCDNACPDGLGLQCPVNGNLCEGQASP